MKYNSLYIITICVNLLRPVYGQEVNSWIKLNWNNDFVFQTDRYYTNGIDIEYFDSRLNTSLLNWFHLPLKDAGNVYQSLSLQQDIYTPFNKISVEKQMTDRPFASYILLGNRKVIANRTAGRIIDSRIQIGITGKYSAGAIVQNGIHDLLPTSSHVVGWENQIETSLVLNYSMFLEKSLIKYKSFDMSARIGGELGTLHTNLAAGLELKIGNSEFYYHDLNFHTRDKLEIYFFSGLSGKFVAHDATLQGSVFTESQQYSGVNIERMVFMLNSGVNFSFAKYKMRLGFKSMTSEFKYGLPHQWGYISFMMAL